MTIKKWMWGIQKHCHDHAKFTGTMIGATRFTNFQTNTFLNNTFGHWIQKTGNHRCQALQIRTVG